MKKIVLFLFLLLSLFKGIGICYAQNDKIDSLKNILNTSVEDTNKINILNQLSFALTTSSLDNAEQYANKANQLSQKLNFNSGLAEALYNTGYVLFYRGRYDNAIETYLQSQKIYEHIHNQKGIARVYNSMGFVYRDKGDYLKATDNYLKSLKIQEAIGNKQGIATATLNIGVLYTDRNDYSQALKYATKALAMFQEIGDKSQTANSFARIGNIYIGQKDTVTCLGYYQKSLALFKQIDHQRGVAVILNNIAEVYDGQGKKKEALNYYFQALETRTKIGDKNGVAIILQNMGICYQGLKDYKNAILYLNKSLTIAKEIGFRDSESASYKDLSSVYETMHNSDKSLEYYKLFFNTYDSLYNEKNTKQLNELNIKYESDKKESDIKLLTADKQLKETSFKKQQLQLYLKLYMAIGGAVLLLVLALFIFNRYKIKQKANTLLEKQKTEINNQKIIIEVKQKEIIDSINYAKRIQYTLLANADFLNEHLPEHFVFFQPKDIVSGDFYWATTINNKFVLVTADCTGHGVPGAFMSLLNMSFLNEAIIEKKIDSPDKILDYVRERIIHSLNPEGAETESKDGMDATVCIYDFKGGWLRFASANNPLWVIRKNELIEFKADKMPVGNYYGDLHPFTLNTLGLRKGDIVYSFTDGFSDQFGGESGKKFKYKPLQQLLLANCDKPMQEQKNILEKTINDWKGNLEQVDDILVIGIRI